MLAGDSKRTVGIVDPPKKDEDIGFLDLAQVYLPLCQQYVTLFCTDEQPDKFRPTCFTSPLSKRWHRVAI